METLRYISCTSLIISFFPGPSILSIGGVSITIFDVLFVVTVLYSITLLFLGKRVRLNINGFYFLGYIYPFTVVSLSVTGAILYGYSNSAIYSDVRWLQLFVISVIIVLSYNERDKVFGDLKWVIYISLFANILFVVLQGVAAITGEVATVLEWWYKDIPSNSNRPLGFNINRYSGLVGQPAGLGFFSAVCITFLVVFVKNNAERAFFLICAIFLLIASGSRTALVSSISLLILYYIYIHSFRLMKYSVYALVVFGAISVSISVFSLDRVVSVSRYQALVELLTGDVAYQEVANRGEIWKEVVNQRNENHILLGTLSNPSVVYSNIPSIDSGYVHSFARLGPFGPFLLIFTFSLPILKVLIGSISNTDIFACLLVVILSIMSINAEVVTSIHGKSMISLTVISISLTNGSIK